MDRVAIAESDQDVFVGLLRRRPAAATVDELFQQGPIEPRQFQRCLDVHLDANNAAVWQGSQRALVGLAHRRQHRAAPVSIDRDQDGPTFES